MAGFEAREVEMGTVKAIEALTVHNKPFLVNELLRTLQPGAITPKMFADMVNESRAYDLNTILTAMTRQIDCSGVVPNLAGVYTDPQDVLEVLMNLGHTQLLKIAQFDSELQDEVFETLRGNWGTTLRALLVLDECQRDVIGQLTRVRQQSPLALVLRQSTEDALKALYKNPENLNSPMFDEVISLDDRSVIYSGEPHIGYTGHVYNGGVVEVWQFFFMPKVDEIRLRPPFERYKVGEILHKITPKAYTRGYVDDNLYNPRTPAGFMGLLGKVGGALPQLIARQVKRNERLREQVMNEEAYETALYELFAH